MTPLIMLQLNEVNFDMVSSYIDSGAELPYMQRLLQQHGIETSSEEEHQFLEPWIQWVSVYTGKRFGEHGVFRLGDSVYSPDRQIFKDLEERGFRVGCIGAMNARNDLQKPAYFVPDPWTDTPTDGRFWSRALASAISQSVNDNSSSKITMGTYLRLCLVILRFVPVQKIYNLAKCLPWAVSRPWRKAIFLDMLIFYLHRGFSKLYRPDFSSVFLNAAAHIQHHYMLSSSLVAVSDGLENPSWYVHPEEDPLLEVYSAYDRMCGEILEMESSHFLVATGLSQRPCKNPVFYYRLINHRKFIELLELSFAGVEPRMTRDFLIKFECNADRDLANVRLRSLHIRGQRIFGEIEEREKQLFVTMDYSSEILEDDVIAGTDIKFINHCVFVAIKNGEHTSKGYAFFDRRIEGVEPPSNNSHVGAVYDYISSVFRQ